MHGQVVVLLPQPTKPCPCETRTIALGQSERVGPRWSSLARAFLLLVESSCVSYLDAKERDDQAVLAS